MKRYGVLFLFLTVFMPFVFATGESDNITGINVPDVIWGYDSTLITTRMVVNENGVVYKIESKKDINKQIAGKRLPNRVFIEIGVFPKAEAAERVLQNTLGKISVSIPKCNYIGDNSVLSIVYSDPTIGNFYGRRNNVYFSVSGPDAIGIAKHIDDSLVKGLQGVTKGKSVNVSFITGLDNKVFEYSGDPVVGSLDMKDCFIGGSPLLFVRKKDNDVMSVVEYYGDPGRSFSEDSIKLYISNSQNVISSVTVIVKNNRVAGK